MMNSELLDELIHFLDDRYLDLMPAIRPALIVSHRRALQRVARIARSDSSGSMEATFALVDLGRAYQQHRDYDARWAFR